MSLLSSRDDSEEVPVYSQLQSWNLVPPDPDPELMEVSGQIEVASTSRSPSRVEEVNAALQGRGSLLVQIHMLTMVDGIQTAMPIEGCYQY